MKAILECIAIVRFGNSQIPVRGLELDLRLIDDLLFVEFLLPVFFVFLLLLFSLLARLQVLFLLFCVHAESDTPKEDVA